jgi:hypothetical protein
VDQPNGAAQDQNQDTNTPEPGSDEYNQQMAERYRQGHGEVDNGQEQPPVPEMPEGGFEKFYNKETGEYNWQAHAQELQYRLDQNAGKSSEQEGQEGDNKDEGTKDGDAKDGDIYEKTGLNPQELEQQIVQNGTLDAEAKEALTKAGVPETLIDMFVSSYTKGLEAERQAIIQEAGGQESWNQISAFVETLPEAEQNAFYDSLGSQYRKYALADIQERMKQAGPLGREKPMINGDAPASGVAGYRSKSEMKKDMADPRYQTDPAFRQQVMNKMAAATWDLDR